MILLSKGCIGGVYVVDGLVGLLRCCVMFEGC